MGDNKRFKMSRAEEIRCAISRSADSDWDSSEDEAGFNNIGTSSVGL